MTYGNSADSLTDAVQRMDGVLYDERKENDSGKREQEAPGAREQQDTARHHGQEQVQDARTDKDRKGHHRARSCHPCESRGCR
ncbi:hypothetical protein [Bacteroides fragilis]|uniref:hypothetical protein n=1 Tax=Bacteroides fragilis TaxID=817 RepID=UPI0012D2BE36|nr:hypothetical protein [Bacteroides fragilis]